MDSHEDRARKRTPSDAAAPHGAGGVHPSDYRAPDYRAPDYRAIARQFASLSAAAARHARATGNDELDQLARRLDSCADAILDDLDRDRPEDGGLGGGLGGEFGGEFEGGGSSAH